MSKGNKSTNGVIFHLKKSEYAEGAQKALKNAKVFISIAEFCQTQQFFDKGTTNIIFAMEELAKASYLQLKALNPHICIANLDSYFHRHDVKHNGLLALMIALEASDINAVNKPDTQKDRIGKSVVNGIVVVCFVLFVV